MNEFFTSFFDVVLYPVNPDYLNLENNPLMLICVMVLIGISIVGIFRRLIHCLS